MELSVLFFHLKKKNKNNQAYKEYVLLLYVESLTIISACKKQFDHTKSSHVIDMKKAFVDLNEVWGGQ